MMSQFSGPENSSLSLRLSCSLDEHDYSDQQDITRAGTSGQERLAHSFFRNWLFRAIFVGYSTRSVLIFGARTNFEVPSRICTAMQSGTFDEVSTDFLGLMARVWGTFGSISCLAAPVTSQFSGPENSSLYPQNSCSLDVHGDSD